MCRIASLLKRSGSVLDLGTDLFIPLRGMSYCFGQKFQGKDWRDDSVCKVLAGYTRSSKTLLGVATHEEAWL